MNGKRIVWIAVAVAALIAAVLTAAWLLTAPVCVLSVNGVKVERDELQYFMDENRIVVAAGFEETYNVDSADPGFWQREFEGTTPEQALRDTAVKALIRDKVQLIHAKEQGIDVTLSYALLAEELTLENEKRAEQLAAGEPVYGPDELDYHFFYVGRLMEAVTALREKLAKTELTVSDAERRAYYEAHREAFTNEDGSPSTFDESYDSLTPLVRDEKYEAYVDRLVETATVTYYSSFDDMTVQ